MPGSTLKKRPKSKTTLKTTRKASAKRKPKSRLHGLLRLNRKGFAKKKFIIFIAAFAVIGGAYMAYRSFADTTLVKADGEYTAVTPARILDTRDGTGGVNASVGQTPVTVQVAGKGGIPATGVKGVVMNVTVTGPTAASFLTVWPADAAKPTTSSLNFGAGQTIPNQVTVKLSPDGKVKIFNNTGKTHVIFDVAGYYTGSDGAKGTRYHSINPQRVLDTRTTTGNINAPVGQTPTPVLVTNLGNIPGSGVKAVTMNVTVTGGTANSNLTIWPTGEAKPATSNLNFAAGQTIPNVVTVKVGSDGKVNVANNSGNTHVIFDVAGYFTDADVGFERTQAGRFVPIQPARRYDSRTSDGLLAAGQSRGVDVTNFGEVPSKDVVDSVVANVTVTGGSAGSFLTLWPNGKARPLASNLNFGAGETIANQVVVKVGTDGKINAFNNTGSTHFIVDIVGYYKKDIDASMTYAYSSFDYIHANSKVDYDVKLSNIPDSNIATDIAFNMFFYGIESANDPSYIGWNSLDPSIILNDGAKGSHYIQFVCGNNAAFCKSTMSGVQKMSQPGADPQFYRVPYNFTAGTTYKFVEELQRNKAGYPGLWSELSIIGSNGIKQQIAIARVSTNATAGYYYGLGTGMNHYTSCESPTPMSYTVQNLTSDGAITNLDPKISPDNEIFCPGISQLTPTVANGGKGVTITQGVAKASRDTIPPAIVTLTPNAAKTQVTVRVTDNKAVAMRVAYVDSTRLGYWAEEYVNTTDNTRVYDTSEIGVGPHNLTVTVIDSSGNQTAQTIPFNK